MKPDKIKIEDLEVFANHGVFPEENVLGQKFVVSAVMYTDTRRAGLTDELTASIHYGEASAFITEYLKSHTFKLLEKVAEGLAEEMLVRIAGLQKVQIEIKKPWAPVGLPLKTVSVEIEREWHTAYIALGSNMGDSRSILEAAVQALDEIKNTKVEKVSTFITTPPYGVTDQPDFLNGCLKLSTLLYPEELLKELNRIEKEAENESYIGDRERWIWILYFMMIWLQRRILYVFHMWRCIRERLYWSLCMRLHLINVIRCMGRRSERCWKTFGNRMTEHEQDSKFTKNKRQDGENKMDIQEWIIFAIELIGTVAFSASGAMVGIECSMDIFGVIVLGVSTAVGGGMVRDVILGKVPSALLHPVYVIYAVLAAVLVFCIIYFRRKYLQDGFGEVYDKLMLAMDSVGLGIFSAMGVTKGISCGYIDNTFLLVFLGTMTGVGGGLLRDMMAGVAPYIFVKHIYACASIAGAWICVIIYRSYGELPAMVVSSLIVMLIRFLAAHYRWNLPRIGE